MNIFKEPTPERLIHNFRRVPPSAAVQVDGAADSPSDSPGPVRRVRSRKRRSDASAGLAPDADFGSLIECGGAADDESGADCEAEPQDAPSAAAAAAAGAAGGFNRTWSGLFVGSRTPQASGSPSSGTRPRQARQAQKAADPARKPRGLAGLLRQPATPAGAAGHAPLNQAGGGTDGHQPPHLMKTSQFRCAVVGMGRYLVGERPTSTADWVALFRAIV